MSKQHRKNRRRDKRAKRHLPSVAPISRKPPVIPAPVLPPRPRVEIDKGLMWCAVQTYPQHEGRVCARLSGMGREIFAPMMEKARVRRNKIYTLKRYMLPRHVFLGIERGEHPRDVVSDVQGVYDLFRFYGNIVMFSASDIQRFADAMRDEEDGTLRPNLGPKNGDSMMVIDGPFASFTAIISGPAADGMIQADVSIFGRSTPVDFHPNQLEALDDRRAA